MIMNTTINLKIDDTASFAFRQLVIVIRRCKFTVSKFSLYITYEQFVAHSIDVKSCYKSIIAATKYQTVYIVKDHNSYRRKTSNRLFLFRSLDK